MPQIVNNGEFVSADVELDSSRYYNCQFTNCRMIYRASGPVTLSHCTFINVTWHFAGAAGDAINFLRVLSNDGGDNIRALLVHTFPAIRDWIRPEILANLDADAPVSNASDVPEDAAS